MYTATLDTPLLLTHPVGIRTVKDIEGAAPEIAQRLFDVARQCGTAYLIIDETCGIDVKSNVAVGDFIFAQFYQGQLTLCKSAEEFFAGSVQRAILAHM